MKINVAPLQNLMNGSHLGEDNTHTMTWCSDNIDYKIEHVMHKCLDLYIVILKNTLLLNLLYYIKIYYYLIIYYL